MPDGSIDINTQALAGIRRHAEEAASVLKAIGSPNRLLLLCFLLEQPRSVNELSALAGIRQSLTSQHLARLRVDNLVEFKRQDQTLIYSIKGELVTEIVSLLCQHYGVRSPN